MSCVSFVANPGQKVCFISIHTTPFALRAKSLSFDAGNPENPDNSDVSDRLSKFISVTTPYIFRPVSWFVERMCTFSVEVCVFTSLGSNRRYVCLKRFFCKNIFFIIIVKYIFFSFAIQILDINAIVDRM
jgi:hypothetical protein